MISPTLLLLSLGFASQATAACTRAFLQEAAATYLKAINAGQSSLLTLSSNASYVENDVILDITKGVLSAPIPVEFSRSFYDTIQCATFTELTSTNPAHPYVIQTHVFYDTSTSTTTATLIDSVVSDDGDWLFNATAFLTWTTVEKWDAIPPAAQDTRATIKAAGDAYLDQWGNVSIPVPHGTPCSRLEGGLYTGARNQSANTCPMGAFPEPITVANRRYVIDEEYGVVSIFNGFPFLESTIPVTESTPSSNLVRVEGGFIRYIHEVTICKSKNCGR